MRPLQYLLASNLLVPQNDSLEHSRLEELDSTEFFQKERWQSGRMRVFAKDVTGQKLVHGFESRPLRLLTYTTLRISYDTSDVFIKNQSRPGTIRSLVLFTRYLWSASQQFPKD